MSLQFSTAVRNAMLDTFETVVGASAVLKIRTGSPPATPATADSGTVLSTISLPADWMNAASGGTKTQLGTWSDTSADASGTAGHFRVYDTSGTTCGAQGTITVTGGGGDMTLDSVSITAGQTVTITTFTLTAPNS